MEYNPISLKDCRPKLFRHFSRYQEVTHVWRCVDGQWVLREENFVQQWHQKQLRREPKKLRRQIRQGCFAYGAWQDGRLVGRACLSPRLFGSQGQYAQLKDLHVSTECRGQGTGRRLIEHSIEMARARGRQYVRLYTSTLPCEAAAQSLYEKYNFSITKRKNRLICHLLYRELSL